MMKTFFKLTTLLFCSFAFSATSVQFSPLGENEIQPQLLTDAQGTTHLLYFKTYNPQQTRGNLYYRTYKADKGEWNKPIKVSAVGFAKSGIIAAAKMAVDNDGRVHVTWFEANTLKYLYTQSNTERTEFNAPKQIVKRFNEGVETGSNIAINGNDVTITWAAGSFDKEYQRAVYRVTSTDGGKNFGAEEILSDQSLGACACCGFISRYADDTLMLAYRTAVNNQGRHMQLLIQAKESPATTTLIHPWEYNACPVTTNNFSHNVEGDIWLVFETEGEIFQFNTNQKTTPQRVNDPNPSVRQKHPAIAVNAAGERLVVWSEGRGFNSGGQLKIRLFSADNEVLPTPNTDEKTLAGFSGSAVSTLVDGSFLVVY